MKTFFICLHHCPILTHFYYPFFTNGGFDRSKTVVEIETKTMYVDVSIIHFPCIFHTRYTDSTRIKGLIQKRRHHINKI